MVSRIGPIVTHVNIEIFLLHEEIYLFSLCNKLYMIKNVSDWMTVWVTDQHVHRGALLLKSRIWTKKAFFINNNNDYTLKQLENYEYEFISIIIEKKT